MATKKYVSLEKLSLYDEKIKKVITDGDAASLAAAKEYTDSLASNYEAAGSVATVQAALQKNIDAVQANVETATATAAAAQADADALEGRMDAAEGKLTALIGEDANKSVRTIANEELAAQLIGENAKESLDTLTEIAAWIQSHPDDASAMNEAIVALQNKVDTGDKTVSAYVTDAINALSIGDYAKAADLTALAGRVEVAEGKITDLETKVGETPVADQIATAIDAIPQADWNQNDEDAADFIKNRTHYEAVEYTPLRDELTITTDEEVSDGVYKSKDIHEIYPSYTREYIRVVFDGVTYDNVWFGDGDGGNPNLIESAPADTVSTGSYKNPEVPFALVFQYQGWCTLFATTPGEHTVAYYRPTSTIKQLDEKFIPDTIARVDDLTALTGRVDTAEGKITDLETKVGETPVADQIATAIDAIPQADWNQNDESAADFIKNRTHYEDVSYLNNVVLEPTVVTNSNWAMGHWGGKIDVTFDRFSVDKEYVVVINGAAYNAATNDRGTYVELDVDSALPELITDHYEYTGHGVVIQNNDYGAGITVNNTMSSSAIDELTVAIYEGTFGIKQLDEKFIPDTIARVADLGAMAAKDVVTESDLDSALAEKVNAAAEGNHSHANKDVLDGITAEKVAAWDAAEQNAKGHADGLNTAMDTRVASLEYWHDNFVECSEEDIQGLFA